MRTRTTPFQATRRVAVAVLALAAVAAGCSQLEEVAGQARGLLGDEQEVAEKVTPEPQPEPEPAGEEPSAPTPPQEEAPLPAVEEGAPALALDLPGIELLTPTGGGGERPVLSWASVEGTASYLVVLRADPEAPASWLWRGDRTEIQVGFVTDPGLGGPEIRDAMVWSVLAFDADDVPIAQSGQRSIAP